MYRVGSYMIIDVLRDRTCDSFKEAWEQYAPDMAYSSFVKAVKNGSFSFLTCQQYNKTIISENEGVPLKGREVIDVKSGYIWTSVSACARYLGVSRQAVLKSIKNGSPCRNRIVQFA